MADTGVFSHLSHSSDSLAVLGTVTGNSYCFIMPPKAEEGSTEVIGLSGLRQAVRTSIPRCASFGIVSAAKAFVDQMRRLLESKSPSKRSNKPPCFEVEKLSSASPSDCLPE